MSEKQIDVAKIDDKNSPLWLLMLCVKMEHMYAISNWKGDNMYEYIIGKVTFVSPYYIVVETNGIGYQISVDNPYRYSGKMDTDIKLYLHQVVRKMHNFYLVLAV